MVDSLRSAKDGQETRCISCDVSFRYLENLANKFASLIYCQMAGAAGFEPAALGFGDRCSSQTELRPYKLTVN